MAYFPLRIFIQDPAGNYSNGGSEDKMIRTCAGQPINIGEMTLIPLERVMVSNIGGKGRFSLYASKKPIGIVFCTSQRRWAINMDGKQSVLETLLQEIEGLQEVMDRL